MGSKWPNITVAKRCVMDDQDADNRNIIVSGVDPLARKGFQADAKIRGYG